MRKDKIVSEKNQYEGPSLDGAQEVALLQDLRDLAQEQGFKSEFKVVPHPDQYHRIHLSVPVGKRFAEVEVIFHDYPAMRWPLIQPAEHEVSKALAALMQGRLSSNGRTLVRVQDMVAILRDAAKDLRRERNQAKQEVPNAVTSQPSLPSLLVGPLAQSLVEALTKALVPPLTDVLMPVLAQSLVPPRVKTKKKIKKRKASVRGAPSAEEGDAYIVAGGVTKLFLPEEFLTRILQDNMRYHPNEYAFLLSGILTPEGIASVWEYYPGEMEQSTPGFCRLKEEFIVDTLYHRIPHSHNLIVWGHVHPIEGPSSTDAHSFGHLADWDRKVAGLGVIAKRSVGMLINGRSKSVRFYDTHTQKPIAHMVVPAAGAAKDKTGAAR